MEIKEHDDFSIDYAFISKYIREENPNITVKTEISDFTPSPFLAGNHNVVEVFGNVGEAESYSNANGFGPGRTNNFGNSNNNPNGPNKGFNNNRFPPKNNNFNRSNQNGERVMNPNDPVSKAKQDFIEGMQEDSLSLDTASKVNHDWKK